MDANALIHKRGRALGNLTKAATFIENIDDRATIEELELRYQKLTSLLDEFSSIEHDLLLLPDQTSKFDEFEMKYFSVQAALSREIKKRNPVRPPINDDLNATINNMCSQQRAYFDSFLHKSNLAQNEVKLPKVNIPPFDGEYTQWPSFKDLFEATVHNNESISKVHKFQLLKGFLKGNAAQFIKHFLITDASNSEAWDKLKKRYDTKRNIVTTTITTFFGQPAIQHASSSSLRNLTETSDELLRGLKALGSNYETRDPWNLHILLNKVDDETKQQWALHSVENDMPNIDDFLEFLHRRCDALESCNLNNRPFKNELRQYTHIATTKIECIRCKRSHPLHKCYIFQRYQIELSKEFVRKHSLCSNCLRAGHNATSCTSINTCFKCKEKHHTLLHEDMNMINENNILKIEAENHLEKPERTSHATTMVTAGENKQLILPTVTMSTVDIQGKIHNVRALLDTGSDSTFINETLARQLGLKRKHTCISVNGLGSVGAGRTRGSINIKLSSRYDPCSSVVVNALILNKLTTFLPSQPIQLDEDEIKMVNEVYLADQRFHEPNAIEMILGIDVFYEVVKERRITLKPNLYLLDSLFGWVVAGYADGNNNATTQCHTIQTSSEDVCQLLRLFKLNENLVLSRNPNNILPSL